MKQAGSDEGALRAAGTERVVRGCRLDGVAAKPLLRVVTPPRIAWAHATTAVVAGGATARITAEGADRFETVQADGEALFAEMRSPDALPEAARPRLYGGFAFHEGHDPLPGEPWHGFPDAMFVLPAVQLTLTGGEAWLTVTATGTHADQRASERLESWRNRLRALPELRTADPPGIVRTRPTPSKGGWREQVVTATDSVRRGALQKVVLAQSLAVDLEHPLDVVDALDRLSDTYPGCFRFLVEPVTGGSFFGATPERLISREGRTVQTAALAGSIGRGETAEEDEWLADQLRQSEKDIHEHELVAETIRDQIEPLATSIHSGSRTVRQLATVQHLQTPIRATLERDDHVLALVEALHPTPAVGGLPPDAALRTIRETEAFDRGWYAAPVGWFDAEGDGSFAVAIRSGLARDRTATLFAGAGLVDDSDPDSEWDELRLKYRPILDELE